MKFMKLVALATAVSCCLTGCSFTGDGILGKDKKDMNIQSTVTACIKSFSFARYA